MAWGIAVATLHSVDLRRAAMPSTSLESSNGGPKTALDMGQKDLI
jgi:hypothetical protein